MSASHIADEKLIAYAIRELGEIDLGIVRDHIGMCPECNATIVLFKTIRGLMLGDYGQDPPLATRTQAHAIFRQTKIPAKRTRIVPKWWLTFQSIIQHLLVPIATASILILILFLGQAIAVSASASLPGDYLYPVRLNAEALQLAFTFRDENKVGLLLEFAQRRMDEITTLKNAERYDSIPIATAAYENTISQAALILDNLAATNPDSASTLGAETVEVVKNNVVVLNRLLNQVPPQARAAIQHAITLSEKEASDGKKIKTIQPKPTATPTLLSTPIPKTISQPQRQATRTPNPSTVEWTKTIEKPSERPKPTTKPSATAKPNPPGPSISPDKPETDSSP